jgi:hypothetical protein
MPDSFTGQENNQDTDIFKGHLSDASHAEKLLLFQGRLKCYPYSTSNQ